MKILVINPGATSTKISVFDEMQELFRTNIVHDATKLASYTHVVEQGPYRKELILQAITEAGFRLEDFDAVCGRGGLLRHIPSGTYQVTDRVIADVMDPPYGEHASNPGRAAGQGTGGSSGDSRLFCRSGVRG